MSLSTNALVSLCDARAYMGLDDTASASLIEAMIEGASAMIHSFVGYNFPSQSYSGVYEVERGQVILPHPNVTAVSFVGVETEEALRVKYTGSDTNARVQVTDTAVVTISRAGATTTTTTSTFASNATTAAMATTIDALSGWDATAVATWPSAYLVRTPVRNAKDEQISLEAWKDADFDYDVDYGAGVVRFLHYAWSAHPVYSRARIEFTAGITVPKDVEQVAKEMVQRAYTAAGRDGAVASESLGDYSVSYQAVAQANADEWWKTRLGYWKRMRP